MRLLVAKFPSAKDRAGDSSWKTALGDAVRNARKEMGLTQAELAREIGVDWTTISGIERGESAPEYATIEAIADVLDRPIDRLVGRSEPLEAWSESDRSLYAGLSDALAEIRSRGEDPLKFITEAITAKRPSFSAFLQDGSLPPAVEQRLAQAEKDARDARAAQGRLEELVKSLEDVVQELRRRGEDRGK